MSAEALPSAGESTDAALWHACMDVLAQEVPPQQFNTWLKPLQARPDANGNGLVIEVANRFKLDWIRSQFLQRMEVVLEQLAERPVPIDLTIAARAPRPAVARAAVIQAARLQQQGAVSPAVPAVAQDLAVSIPVLPAGQPLAAAPTNDSRLDRERTFDNLVEGSANRMARTAALHVASQPGIKYNPLFIYGGVGLGKTHLLQAVGNQLLQQNPQARVLYIHAEQFVNDVVAASRRNSFDDFKSRYHSLDLLLIDDVQFFAGKEKTQEEFFNAFEALLSKKSHIVMTSDTYPKGLANITQRLVSRFDSGLSVAMEPPGLEMRVAILMNKAQAEGQELSEDVAFFVAKNVRANVRELEGALQNILAYSRFSGRAIDIQLVREALRDLLSIKNRQISVENIQKTVADFYKIKIADMHSKKRPAHIARPRQIAMYLAKELTQKSLPEIGDMFGGRDHTTVLHAVRKIAKERNNDQDLNQQLHVLEQTIKG